MTGSTIERFEQYLDTIEIPRRFGVQFRDFATPPRIVVSPEPTKTALQLVKRRESYLLKVSPGVEEDVRRIVHVVDWTRCAETLDGVEYLLDALGWDKSMYQELTAYDRPREGESRKNCERRADYACDATHFLPTAAPRSEVTRIGPDHPAWPSPELGPPEHPFMYVAIVEGRRIAVCSVSRKLGLLDDALWAMSVRVDPHHRRQGYGKAVSSAATAEVLSLGGLALWSTDASNPGSVRIAEALGYRRIISSLKIPA